MSLTYTFKRGRKAHEISLILPYYLCPDALLLRLEVILVQNLLIFLKLKLLRLIDTHHFFPIKVTVLSKILVVMERFIWLNFLNFSDV